MAGLRHETSTQDPPNTKQDTGARIQLQEEEIFTLIVTWNMKLLIPSKSQFAC
jgi:hypothetical protein